MLETVGTVNTPSNGTSQCTTIFCLRVSGTGESLLHTIASGCMPIPLNSLTLCWVGFVFNSPVDEMLGKKVK